MTNNSPAQNIHCDRCGLLITREYTSYNGGSYHNECFNKIALRCASCNRILYGEYITHEGVGYHQECYTNKIAPRCDVCNTAIFGEYRVDFWGLKYHTKHANELSRCDFCTRIICEATTKGGREYSDGRVTCNLCYKSAVNSDSKVKRNWKAVKKILNNNKIRFDDPKLTIQLVDVNRLIEVSGNKGVENEAGFCQYELLKRGNRIVEEKNTIYILHGMPETMFRGVLAHELMHAWMNMNKILNAPPKIREGSANYASYIVYATDKSDWAMFLIENLRKNPDTVYGDGFREIEEYVNQFGIPSWLRDLRTYREE